MPEVTRSQKKLYRGNLNSHQAIKVLKHCLCDEMRDNLKLEENQTVIQMKSKTVWLRIILLYQVRGIKARILANPMEQKTGFYVNNTGVRAVQKNMLDVILKILVKYQ